VSRALLIPITSPVGSLVSFLGAVDFKAKCVQNLHPPGATLRSRVSVIDRFEEELVARLRELRPLAIEYHQLEQVARRLGLALDNGHTPPPRKRKSSRKTTPTKRSQATSVRPAPTASAGAATAQTSATSAQQRPRRSSSSSPDKHRTGSHRQSRRQQDVLRLIYDRPGITVKKIATELGVDATNLYRHVRELQQDGLITKHGTALQPTSR
jgi:Winged helix-turn-helix DNA-binding